MSEQLHDRANAADPIARLAGSSFDRPPRLFRLAEKKSTMQNQNKSIGNHN